VASIPTHSDVLGGQEVVLIASVGSRSTPSTLCGHCSPAGEVVRPFAVLSLPLCRVKRSCFDQAINIVPAAWSLLSMDQGPGKLLPIRPFVMCMLDVAVANFEIDFRLLQIRITACKQFFMFAPLALAYSPICHNNASMDPTYAQIISAASCVLNSTRRESPMMAKWLSCCSTLLALHRITSAHFMMCGENDSDERCVLVDVITNVSSEVM
jgi:hypothetical protein